MLRLLVLALLVVLVTIPNCSGGGAASEPSGVARLAGRSVVVVVGGTTYPEGPTGAALHDRLGALGVRVDGALAARPRATVTSILGVDRSATSIELFRRGGYRTVVLAQDDGARSGVDRGADRREVTLAPDALVDVVAEETSRATAEDPVAIVVLLDASRGGDELVRRLVDPLLAPERSGAFAVLVTAERNEVAAPAPWVLVADGALDAGRVVGGPVALAGTLPTFVELFGLPRPTERVGGASFADAILGDDGASTTSRAVESVDLDALGYGGR